MHFIDDSFWIRRDRIQVAADFGKKGFKELLEESINIINSRKKAMTELREIRAYDYSKLTDGNYMQNKLWPGDFMPPLSGPCLIDANEYVVKSVQILAKKRSGKSYLLGLIAEQLMDWKFPIVIIDPIGAHWGLREKYDIMIFGDPEIPRTDISIYDDTNKKLEEQADLIGRFVAGNKKSVLLDLSHMEETHQQVFGAKFFKTLYKLNVERRHLFVEEADVFAPQIALWEEVQHCRHQLDNLVRRGGQKGIGTTVATQRPAVVSKNILTQSDLTIVMNIIAPQDMKAIMDVIKFETWTKEIISQWRETFKKLKVGEAYFYSPQWLDMDGLVKINERKTYHAGATLGDPGHRKNPVPLVKIPNLDELKQQLSQRPFISEKTKLKYVDEAQSQIISLMDTIQNQKRLLEDKDEQLKRFNQDLTTTSNQVEEMSAELSSYIKLKEALGELMPSVIKESWPAGKTTAFTMDAEPDTEFHIKQYPDVVMRDNESSIRGKILWLIGNGKFKESSLPAQIHGMLENNWEIGTSNKMGGQNANRFSKKMIAELDGLCKRPTQLLKCDNNLYELLPGAKDRIRIIKPEIE